MKYESQALYFASVSTLTVRKSSQRPVYAKENESSGERDYLVSLGDRVREARARRGMSRKLLAADSGVSERYLAQLEAG
ncbi:MAG: helix-turn-helix domain-containing protein, partial [Burkholderiales bacterium]